MRLVLLGAPGAGKGTQAAHLSKVFGLAHIASGDLFRAELEKNTDLGKLAKQYIENGQLVPDEITVRMVLERISRPDCQKGFVLDGFPRTLEQAKALDQALEAEGKSIDEVLYIKVSTEELVRRTSGRWICRNCQTPYHYVSFPPKIQGVCDRCGGELYQRADDKEETVRERLKVYFTQTAPLIDYYTKAGKLIEVNGEQTVEVVSRELEVDLR